MRRYWLLIPYITQQNKYINNMEVKDNIGEITKKVYITLKNWKGIGGIDVINGRKKINIFPIIKTLKEGEQIIPIYIDGRKFVVSIKEVDNFLNI